MKSISSKKSFSRLQKIFAVSALILILFGIGGYVYLVNRQQNDNIARDASTVRREQVKPNSVSQSHLPSKSSENSTQTDQAAQSSTETPSVPPEKPTIERAGGSPTIKVVATFQKTSAGYCELQLSKSGEETLSYTSDIIVGSSYYSCSFSVARPSDNSWSVIVLHHIGNAVTRSDAKDLQ